MTTQTIDKDPQVTLAAEPLLSPLQFQEIMQTIHSLSKDINTTNKELMKLHLEQEGFVRASPADRTYRREQLQTIGRRDDAEGSRREPRQQGPPPSDPRIRMEAPRFSGDDPQGWIFRVQRYFDMYNTPDNDRLYMTLMLIDHPASDWFRYYTMNNEDATWTDFLTALRQRFDAQYYENYLGVLSKVQQTGSVLDYQAAFEKILTKITGVPDSTFVALFISGLRQPLQRELNIRKPATLDAAIALARELEACHEEAAAVYGTPHRRSWQPRHTIPITTGTTTQSSSTAATPTPSSHLAKPYVPIFRNHETPINKLPIVRVSAAEKADRSRRGICWYCDERWAPSHMCKHKFLAYMGDDEDDTDDANGQPVTNDADVITDDISAVHALFGNPSPRALKLIGRFGNRDVQILIDTGSTHNFIHPRIAEQLSCSLIAIKPFRVYVGNGASLICSYYCPKSQIVIQGITFAIDLHILEIHGPDIILGMQWLQSIRRVTHDYVDMTMDFNHNGLPIQLQGVPPDPKQISIHALSSFIASDETCELYELFQVDSITAPATPIEFPTSVPDTVCLILQARIQAFQTPVALPPIRRFDHRIHLLPGTKPVNVRPYRYPYFQKTEIEKQVREMLEQGIIQPSHSPFSSPVLLVRKKGGSFRFCIDYRALNAATVPNHFPIPTTDELFDELGAARVFTKLDLRAGYHQIRMHESDIFKNCVQKTRRTLRVSGYAIRTNQRTIYIPVRDE